jgi:hypothetical protein
VCISVFDPSGSLVKSPKVQMYLSIVTPVARLLVSTIKVTIKGAQPWAISGVLVSSSVGLP